MILAPVSPVMDRKVVLLSPTGEKKEKNWVIAVVGSELFLIHWLSPMSVYKYVGIRLSITPDYCAFSHKTMRDVQG